MGFPTPRDTQPDSSGDLPMQVAAPLPEPLPPTRVREQAEAVQEVPAGAEQLARRGAAWLNHLQAFANAAQNDLESFLPQTAVTSVEAEVETIVKGLFS